MQKSVFLNTKNLPSDSSGGASPSRDEICWSETAAHQDFSVFFVRTHSSHDGHNKRPGETEDDHACFKPRCCYFVASSTPRAQLCH